MTEELKQGLKQVVDHLSQKATGYHPHLVASLVKRSGVGLLPPVCPDRLSLAQHLHHLLEPRTEFPPRNYLFPILSYVI